MKLLNFLFDKKYKHSINPIGINIGLTSTESPIDSPKIISHLLSLFSKNLRKEMEDVLEYNSIL